MNDNITKVKKILNEMTKEELVNCIISKHIVFYIDEDRAIRDAKSYLLDALFERLDKINKIKTGDLTKAKNRKEMLEIMEADNKKYKKWESINKRIEELMKEN